MPSVLVTDKLASYGAAHRVVMPSVAHRRSKYLNNRAENSHQPTRQRERAMKRFKSARHAVELGWYPADLDDESLARHRAEAVSKSTDRDPAKRWAHLTEAARQREVEQRGRDEVADLYESAVLPGRAD